jgi:hypothetical protein
MFDDRIRELEHDELIVRAELKVSLHDVINGAALPKNTCSHCGRALY